jgi:hypothetical protein
MLSPLKQPLSALHIHTRRRASLRIFVILKRRITVWLRSFSPLFYVSLFLSAAEILGDVDFAERERKRLKIIFIRVQLSNLPFSPQKVRSRRSSRGLFNVIKETCQLRCYEKHANTAPRAAKIPSAQRETGGKRNVCSAQESIWNALAL